MSIVRNTFLDEITPVVLTYNEENNIDRTLKGIDWAKNVVVVDSYSSDSTCLIVKQFTNVRLFRRRFDSHANQWNFAISETGITTEWILALDADYVLQKNIVIELARLRPPASCSGYAVEFTYCVRGLALRGTLYPRVTVLFRRSNCKYIQTGHTQRIQLSGNIERLRERILHDDRKPLSRWLVSQQRYARIESEYLLGLPKRDLRLTDWVRAMAWPAPILIFFYVLFVKGCFRDGRAGLFYAFQRTVAELMIALELIDKRLSAHKTPQGFWSSNRDSSQRS
jgi:glycosyltransferase involved in cell wall biosynthesis